MLDYETLKVIWWLLVGVAAGGGALGLLSRTMLQITGR